MFDPTKCESVSMAQAKAQEEQNPVSAALRATSIAFVTLAESGQIDDTTATENVTQFAPGPTLWRTLSAISASITANFSVAFKPTLHKQTGRRTQPLLYGRKSAIRLWNGRTGPNLSAHTTPTIPAIKCPTTGNTGLLPLTRTSGNLVSMAGRR